ncbi:MAG: cation transporter [Flavobacteriales bacterium]
MKRPAVDDCACEVPEKKSLFQRTGFLITVTVFAVITSAYPLYAGMFNTKASLPVAVDETTVQRVVIDVKGMTCAGCEAHVNAELSNVSGVAEHSASYEVGSATVLYDPAQATEAELIEAIERAGYTASIPKPKDQ